MNVVVQKISTWLLRENGDKVDGSDGHTIRQESDYFDLDDDDDDEGAYYYDDDDDDGYNYYYEESIDGRLTRPFSANQKTYWWQAKQSTPLSLHLMGEEDEHANDNGSHFDETSDNVTIRKQLQVLPEATKKAAKMIESLQLYRSNKYDALDPATPANKSHHPSRRFFGIMRGNSSTGAFPLFNRGNNKDSLTDDGSQSSDESTLEDNNNDDNVNTNAVQTAPVKTLTISLAPTVYYRIGTREWSKDVQCRSRHLEVLARQRKHHARVRKLGPDFRKSSLSTIDETMDG